MSVIPKKEYLKYYLSIDELAKKAYLVLTKKKFSREEPCNPSGVMELLEYFLLERYHPIQLLGLWGGSKESRTMTADKADLIVLENLKKLENCLYDSIADVKSYEHLDQGISLKEVRIKLLFCDAHHIIANRRSLEESLTYYESLKEVAKKYDFEVLRLAGEKLLGVNNHQS